ncbi:MAG: MmgE/PrpD family protein [Smithellaceae bacterium]|nr:MmgE/PrpD family protein [Syntrophaceae bacterium]MDD4241254.1 MmgE/PrpD family protein [Smithellaceae bacterium]
MDHTEKLAAFLAGLSDAELPPDVVQKAKLCLLDYIANVYGSLELEATRKVIAHVRSLNGPAAATVFGGNFKTDIHHAAFLNGTTGEAIEAQDGLRFGGNHPGTSVIPATLAVAEEEGLGGRAVIKAVVTGYEAANRPAGAMHPWHTLSGFLPTGTCGTFGAAAAAASLWGFDAARMQNALGCAGYLAPLSMAEQLMEGCTIKIVQGGQAALAGLLAAGLAKAGITGDRHVFEGSALKGGLLQITAQGTPNFEKLTEKMGAHYTILDIYFKPYTACRHTHGAVQAVLELAREFPRDPQTIAAVNVFTYGMAAVAVGKGAGSQDTFVNAQFSIPYCVASALQDGMLGPRQLTEKRLADPQLLALARKVSVQVDEALNKVYPDKTASRVEIVFLNGEKIDRQVNIPKGDPRDPMAADDIADKVRFFAGNRDRKKTEQIIETVLHLESLPDIRTLTALIL